MLSLAAAAVSAHSGKARFHVAIDTDGAADDLRAICIFLGSADVEVLCITSSQGAQSAHRTAQCAAALLRRFGHDGIPVGQGRRTGEPAPRWRRHSEMVEWGRIDPSRRFADAPAVMAEAIDAEPERVTIVALGALTNVAEMLRRRSDIAAHIERIVWYDELPEAPGANFAADPEAARRVLRSGVTVEIVSAGGRRPIPVTPEFVAAVDSIPTPYARCVADTHLIEPLASLVGARHLALWDDLTALYLLCPELFACHPAGDELSYHTLSEEISDRCAMRMLLAAMWPRPDSECRVLGRFPARAGEYAADVAAIVDSTTLRYGAGEWRAAVLTNELHGHLGIYATIGVKMGIRAREWFGIGIDDMEVVSMAGLAPPVSCLNDGLQTATGATLGHGLITVEPSDTPRAEAVFRFKNRAVRLRLRREYADRIEEDCRRGAELYGGLSPEYWQYVRALAIACWRDLDRHEIFEIEEL